MPLPPTPCMQRPDSVPYFLWDLGLTLRAAREALLHGSSEDRDEILVRLLREANTRDVWAMTDWNAIDEAWPRVAYRLGRSRAIWEMLRARRQELLRDEAR